MLKKLTLYPNSSSKLIKIFYNKLKKNYSIKIITNELVGGEFIFYTFLFLAFVFEYFFLEVS